MKCYADKVLDKLDPKKEIFTKRLFRDSCVVTSKNIYVKDLRIFKNRDLKNIIIIDNSSLSFSF